MRMHALRGLLLLALSASAQAYEVETLLDSGDPSNRIDLLILGDGYRIEDQTKMTADANDFLSEYWAASPSGAYQGAYNVWLVHVVSNENGADNGTYGASRDTALGAYFNCYGIDRLLCVNDSAVYQAAADHLPAWDQILVMVNDPKYGGSGGNISVFSTNSMAGQIAIHELGHSFAGLADEYEDAYPGYPGCGEDCPEPNVTNHTTLETTKWSVWIEAGTPLPTPETAAYLNTLGLFEGARYFSSGVYRPKQNCTMRSLGTPFCEVCQEALIWAVWDRISPIDSVDPPAGPLVLESCESRIFQVNTPALSQGELRISWEINAQVTDSDVSRLELSAPQLGEGSHTLRVLVEDLTERVRRDPDGLLSDSRLWTVQVSNPCGDELFCNGEESCQAGQCVAEQEPCADDGLDCTETCVEALRACNVLQPGFCLIDKACWAAGQTEPGNACRRCESELDSDTWTLAPEAMACDDGDACTAEDSCLAGVCVGLPVCSELCDCPDQKDVSGGCGCSQLPTRTGAIPLALLALLALTAWRNLQDSRDR